MEKLTSHLITFLIGVFTGAAGKYLADKFTDKRRNKEKISGIRKTFLDVAGKMPDLIKEIQDDLSKPECMIIREFFILPNDRVSFNSGGERYLFFFEEQHENLKHKVKLLEDHGFVHDVTHTNTPKYRMTEEFVNCVIKAKIKSKNVKL
jgi:hypothetical protein